VKVRWWQGGLLAVVGLFFLFAGATKIPDPRSFQASIEAYRLVSGTPALVAALYLPFLEITAAAALLFPKWRRAGGLLLAALLLLFQAALAAALFRGLDLDCGCLGGDGADMSAALAFLRNCGLLLLLLLGFFPRKSSS